MSSDEIDGRFQRHRVIPKSAGMPTPQDDMDIVAYLRINLRRNSAMSIEGHLGDKRFVLALLDNARDAIERQIPENDKFVVPGNEVSVPNFGDFGPKAKATHPLAAQYFTAHAALLKSSPMRPEYPLLVKTEAGTKERWVAHGCPLTVEE